MGSGNIHAVSSRDEHAKQMFLQHEKTIILGMLLNPQTILILNSLSFPFHFGRHFDIHSMCSPSAFQKHFNLGVSNEDFAWSYHVDGGRSKSTDSVGINTMRGIRQSEMLNNWSEGIFYTTQYVKERVNSFFETEGITLRNEQRQRLNSLWDEEGLFGEKNNAEAIRASVLSDTKSMVLKKENTEMRLSTIEPDNHLLQAAIEMAL